AEMCSHSESKPLMIEFDCPSCARHFNLRDELAGKQARCKCGQAIAIPLLLSESDVISDLLDEDGEYRLQAELPRQQPVPDLAHIFIVEAAVSVPTDLAGRIKQQIRTAITAYIGRSGKAIDVSRMRVFVN